MVKCWLLKGKINAYAAGELNPKYTKGVEAHLKKCLKCRQQVTEIKKITDAVSNQENPFLGEVFWRKFDERLDLMLANEAAKRQPVSWSIRQPKKRVALAMAIAACALLIFFFAPFGNNFIKDVNIRLSEGEFVETVLLVEDAAELDLLNDEDSYVEEYLLQLELRDV